MVAGNEDLAVVQPEKNFCHGDDRQADIEVTTAPYLVVRPNSGYPAVANGSIHVRYGYERSAAETTCSSTAEMSFAGEEGCHELSSRCSQGGLVGFATSASTQAMANIWPWLTEPVCIPMYPAVPAFTNESARADERDTAMQLHGIHHLTAVSADARGNHDFYTRVLGMRLVKKTVNQDDVSAYHLFYADGVASPGTDLTFFDWPVERERRGTNAIVRTALRVAGRAALEYWVERLDEAAVQHGPIRQVDGRSQLEFEDPEGQRLALVDDGGTGPSHPWSRSPVPEACQIRGLGPITLSVPELAPSNHFLTEVMAMRRGRSFAAPDSAGVTVQVFEMGAGGPAAELHVRVEPGLPRARQGAGAVHHVAFRVADNEYAGWIARLEHLRIPSSGPVDRFYFRSLYTREPNGILYEIATDGPGFTMDEPLEALGERLSLPPFLEPQRSAIERNLKPL